MAFPTIPTGGRVVTGVQTGTSATRTFPSLTGLTKNNGDLLIAIIVGYQSSLTSAIFSAWGAGFTEIRDIGVTTQHCVGVAYKISDGTETGTFSVTQAGTVTGDSAFILLSIPGAHGTTAPEVSAALATGTAAAADPASLNPAGWDAEDTLWVSVLGNGETATGGTFTGTASAPTNYGDYAETSISQDAVGGVQAAVSFRQLNASSEDVGAGTVDLSNARNCAFVIAVRPLPVTTVNGSFTANAVIFRTQTASLTANAVLKRFDQPGSLTADAIIRRLNQPGSLTADAVLRATITGSFTADAVLFKTISASFSADAVIFRSQSASLTADAVLFRTQEASFTLDAVIDSGSTPVEGSFTADAIKLVTGPWSETYDNQAVGTAFTINAILRREQSASLTADAILRVERAASFTLDAVIIRTQTHDFSVDAVVRRTQSATLTADAVIRATSTVSITANAVIAKTVLASFTADAVILLTRTGGFVADAVLLSPRTQTFTADAVLRRTTVGGLTADAIVRRTQSATFTADAVIAIGATTITSNLSADAVLRTTRSQSLTADAVLAAARSGSFVEDAVLRRTTSAVLTSDAVLRATRSNVIPADAVLRATRPGTLNADAVVRRADLSASFTIDAVLTEAIDHFAIHAAVAYARIHSVLSAVAPDAIHSTVTYARIHSTLDPLPPPQEPVSSVLGYDRIHAEVQIGG